MGLDERRGRERTARIEAILKAALAVAEREGWGKFSVERVAAEAELGRATVYGYFDSIDDLVVALAESALLELEDRVARALTAEAALDVPVRLLQTSPAKFELLFPQSNDPRSHMSSRALRDARARAQELLSRIERVAAQQSPALPTSSRERAAFLAGVCMAGAAVPELRSSTTLRHRFQRFCLSEIPSPAGKEPGDQER